MLSPKKKLPTLAGLFLLLLILGLTVGGIQFAKNLLIKASPDKTPQNTKITNLSDNGFSVSFLTSAPFMAAIKIDNRTFPEEDLIPKKLHHLTIKNLRPNQNYTFAIISGGETFNLPEFTIMTASSPETSPSTPIVLSGTVMDSSGRPASGALVYITLPNALPISAIVNNSGNWLLTLNKTRDVNTKSPVILTGKETVQILIQGEDVSSEFSYPLSKGQIIPDVVLGQSYDFAMPRQNNIKFATPEPVAIPVPVASLSANLPLLTSPLLPTVVGTPAATPKPATPPVVPRVPAPVTPPVITPPPKSGSVENTFALLTLGVFFIMLSIRVRKFNLI